MAQAGRKARCKIAQTIPTCKDEMTYEERSVSDGCPQSAYCPYEGQPVTVLIGCSKKRYTISSVLLEKFPSLLPFLKKNPSPPYSGSSVSAQGVSTSVALADVDEDIGHTFMHYLYTGTFQILKVSSSTCGQPIGLIDYTQSVLAYRAAIDYGLGGLEDLAKRWMEIFDQHVTIFDIITLAREHFPKVMDNQWYSNYLTSRIVSAVNTKEDVFRRKESFEQLGYASEFDKFLAMATALAFSTKLSAVGHVLQSACAEDTRDARLGEANHTAIKHEDIGINNDNGDSIGPLAMVAQEDMNHPGERRLPSDSTSQGHHQANQAIKGTVCGGYMCGSGDQAQVSLCSHTAGKYRCR